MAKKVFLSFYYAEDVRRVSQIKQMGALAAQPVLDANSWEQVERGGDPAIQGWIDREMKGKDCLVVLIGSHTAGRRWVNYEIEKAWNDGLGVLGVHIHGLRDPHDGASTMGHNPFAGVVVAGKDLEAVVDTYNPTSTDVYGAINTYIEGWIDKAVSAAARR
jgi:hypothetical protein